MPDQGKNQAKNEQEQIVHERSAASKLRPEELKKKKRRNMIAIIVILFMLAIVIAWFLSRPKGMTEGNYKQIMEEMDSEVKEGYFETYMNTEWTFPDGKSETTDAILGNSPNNKKPIRCEIILADTEEVVLKTDVIPVGAELPPFKLDVNLEAGTYEAVCMVYLLNEEKNGTYTEYSNAGFNITITVQN